LISQIEPKELAGWRADDSREPPLVVDVREPWELGVCRIEGARSVPLAELPRRAGELPRDRDLVLVCHHGSRSLHAAAWLARAGYPRVHNLRGGIAAWADLVDPAMPRY
jgi:rhodanese-related sulfurtransferase